MKNFLLLFVMSICFITMNAQTGDPKLTEVWQPEPSVVAPGKTSLDAPSDALILFNGKDLSQWQAVRGGAPTWNVLTEPGGKNGFMQVNPGTGNIQTKKRIWRLPAAYRMENT